MENTTKETKITDLIDLHEKTVTEFEKRYWESARENKRFRRGDHWTEKQKKLHETEKRLHYSIPIVESKTNIIASQQMQSPYALLAVARNTEFELGAEIKSSIFKYLSDMNELQYINSEIYMDGMFKKYGVWKRYQDYTKDPTGEIIMEKVIYDNFIWDLNCQKYSISKHAEWVQEIMYMTREEMKAYFPDKAELIDRLPSTDQLSDTSNKYVVWQRLDRGKEIVRVVRHGERCRDMISTVLMSDGSITEEDAEVITNEQQRAEYDMAGVVYPVKKLKRLKESTKYIYFTKDCSEILSEEYSDNPMFQYHVYFSNNDDGDIWCFMDIIKDPQIWIDRLSSQIDYSIGTLIKNSYQITDWSALHEEDKEKWNELQAQLVKGGAVLRFNGNRGTIMPINSGNMPPEIFNTWQYMVQVLEDITGGRNFQGLKESANESGVKVQALQNAGFMMSYLFMYNFGRSLRDLGEGLNEDINEVYGNSVGKVLAITDNDLDVEVKKAFTELDIYQPAKFMENKNRGYIKINEEAKKQILGAANSQIIIEKGEYIPTERDKKLNEWYKINELRVQGGEQPLPTSIAVDILPFDMTTKQRIKAFEQQQEQMKQQRMEMEKTKLEFDANASMLKENREAMQAVANLKSSEANVQQQKQNAENPTNNPFNG